MLLLNLQKGLFAELSGDATLSAAVTGIFDHVPQEQTFPYVLIGEAVAEDFDDDSTEGFDVECTIHVWTRSYRGRAEAKEAQALIHGLLHRKPVAVTGADTVETIVIATETFRDPDGLTTHGVQRVRVILSE